MENHGIFLNFFLLYFTVSFKAEEISLLVCESILNLMETSLKEFKMRLRESAKHLKIVQTDIIHDLLHFDRDKPKYHTGTCIEYH